jgi:N-acetylmuramoyl-L-alanine amidase
VLFRSLAKSQTLANTLHDGMADVLQDSLRDRGVKGESHTRIGRINGALTTSIFSEVPTATVEMVFLTNPGDANFIKSEAGQNKMAEALAKGVKNYLKSSGILAR